VIAFSISALEKAPVNKSGSLPEEFLDLAPEDAFTAASPVEYDLTASLVSGGVLVSGSVAAAVCADCGRCLQPVLISIGNDDLHLFFEIADGQEILEVDEDIRAELLLDLPMNPLCSPDCRGLCPVCGCDLNEGDCQCDTAAAAGKVSPWSALDGLEL